MANTIGKFIDVGSLEPGLAVIIVLLATISAALRWDVSPSSAAAMARADAVRCSMRLDDADSERSKMDANGAISFDMSASKRAMWAVASSSAALVPAER